ncbi:MAG TPA: helix-turn-helix domain-containing protein [Vicinamibacterales bacterium]|nr:helix-turn-helix domain-containing protein [Vicinamibacterales bacterium]
MTVFSSHLLDYGSLGLGARIREERQRLGLTLKQLAAATGVSMARLSEIENGLHVADLSQALTISAALKLPVDALLPRDARIPFQITREGDVRARAPQHQHGNGVPGNEFWELANLFIGRHLNPMFGRIRQHGVASPVLWQHHAEEFLFVLRGAVAVTIDTPDGLVREELSRGDWAYLRPDLAHSLSSLDEEPAETVQVQASVSSPVEPGSRWVWADVSASADGPGDDLRRIGQRLRWLRKLHRWELEEVADQVGITPRQLQRVEDGERALPLDRVLRIARLFGVPLAEVVEPRPGARPFYCVQRAKDLDQIPNSTRRTPVEREHEPQSKTCQQLATCVPSRQMFPCFIRLLNVDIERLTMHEHHGHEFIYVLDGELELTTYVEQELVTEHLRPGDSCYIDSSVPHLVRARTRNPFSETSAQVLDVFWSPLGEKYLFG